jgi:hypothetical protein
MGLILANCFRVFIRAVFVLMTEQKIKSANNTRLSYQEQPLPAARF